VLRDGADVTIVTWGAQVKEALEAAEELAKDGIGAEVIDVATLRPFDFDTVAESVARNRPLRDRAGSAAQRRLRRRDRGAAGGEIDVRSWWRRWNA
jgi:pyruvate/2-oxoacid:ferredoxin oxidoreductase alpha subunit